MPPRLLIVKLAALGDAAMASTLVGAARDRWPGAELVWVAGRSVAPLVRLFDGVDRVIEVNDRRLLRGGPVARAAEVVRAWRAIGRGYDVAFLAHTDPRYGVLTALCGARELRRVPLGKGRVSGVWSGTVYAAMAGEVTAPPRFATLRRSALPLLPDVPEDGPLVLIAPGGARNVLRDDHLRRWPLPQWVELVGHLRAAGCTVVAVGSPGDNAEGAACAAAGAQDLTGRTDLPTLISLIDRAACVVTHDSGTLHLAFLTGTHVVALFGPTAPEERLPPLARVRVMSSAAGLACAPCYDGTGYASCANNLCLNRVSPQSVAHAVIAAVGRPRTA